MSEFPEGSMMDPFAAEQIPEQTVKGNAQMKTAVVKAVKSAERGTYTEQTFAPSNQPAEMQYTAAGLEAFKLPAPQNDTLEGTYSRVEELAESVGFYKLEELEGKDLIILSLTPGLSAQYKNVDGTPSEYCVMEFLFAHPSDNPDSERGEPPYNAVIGGISLKRVKSAAKQIVAGKASGPLVANFEKKMAVGGNSFWSVR